METRPYDPYCNRHPDEIPEYIERSTYSHPDEYVRLNEGTYNRENGHFACTECYIRLGCPSSSYGWKAP
jgi:hypothetical protein